LKATYDSLAGTDREYERGAFSFVGMAVALRVMHHRGTTHHTKRKTTAMTTLKTLINDEAGFIVSAELVLISTIAVLGLVVGLSEVSINVNNELEDVGSAFSSMNQSYTVQCTSGHKGWKSGNHFEDGADFCDSQCDVR
jgi:hypothetical protein